MTMSTRNEERELRDEASIRLLSARPDADNRREHPRYGVELDVSFASDHNFYIGFTENLSEGGIFVATHSLKPVGTRVSLCLFLHGSESAVRCLGEVRWVRPYNEHSNVAPGMGIRFLDLPAEDRAEIQRFLDARDPIFYDDE